MEEDAARVNVGDGGGAHLATFRRCLTTPASYRLSANRTPLGGSVRDSNPRTSTTQSLPIRASYHLRVTRTNVRHSPLLPHVLPER